MEPNNDNEKETAKLFIEKNWKIINNTISQMIKDNIQKKEVENLELTNYKIIIIFDINKNQKKLILKSSNNTMTFPIPNELRKINFKFYKNNEKDEKNCLILQPEEIIDYINKFNIVNPFYYKDNMLNKFIFSEVNTIFKKSNINEIFDLNKEDIPDLNTYNNYVEKIVTSVKDLYINNNIDEYCDKIYGGLFQKSKKREDLNTKIINFVESDNPVLLLNGPSKIGKSVSILDSMNNLCLKYLYIDLKYMTTLKDENKNTYFFNECFRLFDDYKKYYNFIKENYKSFQNLYDILSFIKIFIKIIENIFYGKIIIILDNYDELYMNEKITSIYIENINNILSKSKIKVIICGNGVFFNQLISEYFSDNKMKYNFYYIDDLELKDLRQANNEYLDYLIKKYDNNKSKILFYLVLFKKALNPITGFSDFKNIDDFPSQYFIFSKNKKDKKIYIQFYSNESINNIEKDVKFYLLSDLVFFDLQFFNNLGFKGIVEEEIILTLFELGKIITIEIDENNILMVNEIFSISNETPLKDKKIDNTKPIIIRQFLSSAEAIDFCLILGKMAFFGQIGLNKRLEKINKVLNKNYKSLLCDISKYIGYDLNDYKIIFIFDKEEIKKLYDELNEFKKSKKQLQEILKENNIDIKNPSNEDKLNINFISFKRLKKTISNCVSKIGPEICKMKSIPYLLFSLTDFKLYSEDNLIITNSKELNNLVTVNNTKIPQMIINQLKNYEDFKNLKELNFLTKVESSIMEFSFENNYCYLNCDALDFYNFNIEYYIGDSLYKITFKSGNIDINDNQDDYSNYYLIKAKFMRNKKLLKVIDDNNK